LVFSADIIGGTVDREAIDNANNEFHNINKGILILTN
tara:strand:+ start:1238 stop:1348 length:111 start_codon:yes stop_codon:yes gene_type:complete